jgi:hypothetical protein
MKIHRLRLLSGILLASICLVFASCKKFEEDDEWIHFRTVKKRIEGKKELVLHIKGPTDMLPYWHARFGEFYLNFTLDSYNPHKKGYGYQLKVVDKKTDNIICNGQWGFLGADVFIEFVCLYSDTSKSFPNNIQGISYPLVKLSNTEMWMRADSSWHSGLKKTVGLTEARFQAYNH